MLLTAFIKEHSEVVIMLGDIFHATLSDNPPLRTVYEHYICAFVSLGLPMIVIGGLLLALRR